MMRRRLYARLVPRRVREDIDRHRAEVEIIETAARAARAERAMSAHREGAPVDYVLSVYTGGRR